MIPSMREVGNMKRLLAVLGLSFVAVLMPGVANAATPVGVCPSNAAGLPNYQYGAPFVIQTGGDIGYPPVPAPTPNATPATQLETYYWFVFAANTSITDMCNGVGYVGYSDTSLIADNQVMHTSTQDGEVGQWIFPVGDPNQFAGAAGIPANAVLASANSGGSSTPSTPSDPNQGFVNLALVAFTDYVIPPVALVIIAVYLWRVFVKVGARMAGRV